MSITDDELVAALSEHGSNRKAAAALGMNVRTIERRRSALSLKGWSPQHDMQHTVPDGFTVGGVSTLYRDGAPILQWVKSRQDSEQVRRMIDGIMSGLCAEIPRVKPTKAPKQKPDGLLNAYIVTDYHLGMLAWGEETGADWDTTIAEDMLVAWFAQAMAEAPDAEVGLLAQLGDFLHWDGWDAVTPASKHLLDADTRFPKLVEVAARACKRIILMMLEKHHRVHVIMAEGNHDPTSSVWLRSLCQAMFHDEPRVTVDMRPDPYYCYEHGQTALFFHHGHKKRLAGIDATFAAKFREVFGRTTRAYGHMGHLHHVEVKETSLMVVEQHRTLAAPDAYASRGGWLSGRDAQVITYDKVYGERTRRTIPAQLVADQLARAA
ncbi:hypothetical protein IP90_00960 [Luteimonas cucumeris]|uniref:Uncharacterized protein n=1 Tax=Luteimonas cucumeris TaxID=985012 RepID=A0A562LAX5_9GAMM|nr:winged helix-turn-helix domain-containing protein [Luteimonas cucumeris]TWI04822.1 hypothetical protein IP90_00960 [Luteimonas cucumeris]